MTYPIGIDVSHWDGVVDWDKAKAAGVAFAFCKATQGISMTDAQFSRNALEARRVGIPMGAYHYYLPTMDPTVQALWFTQAAPVTYGLPHVLDLESTYGIPSGFAGKVRSFLVEVEAQNGIRPIIYTSYSFWAAYMGDLDWACDYPLWIANYRNQAGPLVPKPWSPLGWSFWQYTDRGKAARYGSQKAAVDLNVANIGALESVPEPPPPPAPPAGRFSSPIGTDAERAAGTIWPGDWFDANPYLTLYNGSYHTGADLNLNLPTWNSDAGALVYAIGAGVVTHAGELPGTWGNVVVIRHAPLADGTPVYSRYAHLASVNVSAGDDVSKGQAVGQVGTMPGRPGWEHLHFDVSCTDILATNPGHWPGGDRAAVVANYVDPKAFLQAHR